MKCNKSLKSVLTMALITVAITYTGLHFSQTSGDKRSDLLKENIEALSSSEGSQYNMMCTTSIQYTGGYSMPLYCRTCSFHYGYVATGGYSQCR